MPKIVLTEDQVREIRRLYKEGDTSQRKLAKQFGVSQGAVWAVVNWYTWLDVV